MTTNGLLVQFAGSTLRFRSTDPDFVTALKTHFRHCLGSAGELVAEYEIVPVGEGAYSIARAGTEIIANTGFESAIQRLMQDALTQLNGGSQTHLILHAAAVSAQDAGVVFCGKSGSGKSTLAAGLLADGFQYLTDEVIAWPVKDPVQASGFCRSLVLKQGSAFIWHHLSKDLPMDGLLRFKDGGAWIAPEILGDAPVCAEVRPRLLIFSGYSAGSPLITKPVSPGEALFRLLQCLVNSRNFGDGGLAAAGRLAHAAPGFSLVYSDAQDAREWIRTRLQES